MVGLVLTLLLITVIYRICKRPLQYWKKKKVPYVEAWPIFGNMGNVVFLRKAFAINNRDFYNKFWDKRYFGFYEFSKPILIIRDPNLIRDICVKHFDSFTDHAKVLPLSDPFWNKNLFSMEGRNWHDIRTILSPVYTSSKMKMLFVLMNDCARDFATWLEEQVPTSMEMKDAYLRYASNLMACTSFGVKADALKDPEDEFYVLGKEAFNIKNFRALKFSGYSMSPTLSKMLKMTLFDAHLTNFFLRIVKNTIKLRKQGLVRMDVIHRLWEAQKTRLKQSDPMKMPITDEDIAAQVMVFSFGGIDVVGSLLSTLSYELATNPDVQQKLADEIARTSEECGQITYQKLLGMKYMDMVVSEALRMWPPAVFITRQSVKPYTIHPELPGEEPLQLRPGTHVWMHVYALHRDPKYFPDPDKFDPERFSEENRRKIVPFTYLPFGAGPRMCICTRFSFLEIKILLFHLLRRFELVPVDETVIPLEMSRKHFILNSKNGVWLGLRKRRKNKYMEENNSD